MLFEWVIEDLFRLLNFILIFNIENQFFSSLTFPVSLRLHVFIDPPIQFTEKKNKIDLF